ncbi:3-methyladenine DNA glycosylase [Methanobrevibacter sp. OttesenSCG-928-K11]|nr:3-methyladenine DNA glycosylase [Methanobrevibacter sp. OttesenSCG-928-K11]MDL2270405.1 3-methyladenine DNA glycosylase [Methanobrevibacter sp. OttesenSCG-928-I08]
MKIKTRINLDLTQYSGQTSQSPWIKNNDKYEELVFVKNIPILFKLSQKNIDCFNFEYELPLNFDKKVKETLVKEKLKNIYDLSFNLDDFYTYLRNDEKLGPSVEFCEGLRLFLAKNKFEAIISSISSANNSIARWTNSISKIKETYGIPYKFSSGTFYSFPKINTLKNSYLDEDDEHLNEKIAIENCNNNLKSCGVGYRADYIKKASNLLNEIDLNEISKMKYLEAFDEIIKVPGVGPKVADCILLYGYDFKEAFPTDVWIKRIISYLYFDSKDISVEKVREFGIETFGKKAGYVQLYLFHYARKSGLMEKLKKIN